MKKGIDWAYSIEKNDICCKARSKLINELQYRSLRAVSTETGLAVNTLRKIVALEPVTWDSLKRLSMWAMNVKSPYEKLTEANIAWLNDM